MNEIETAVDALRRNEVVVYPTETVYGLGADACSGVALERLVHLKVREDGKPISVLIAGSEMLHQITECVSALAERLISRWWPGPLTLVVQARPEIPQVLTAGTGTIGVRISSHPLATFLVARLGRPLTAPSANPAGASPARTLAEARRYFGERVAAYVDGGELRAEAVSTVVDVTGSKLRIVREGMITSEEIFRAALEQAA